MFVSVAGLLRAEISGCVVDVDVRGPGHVSDSLIIFFLNFYL